MKVICIGDRGYNLKCEVKDLNPDAHINFRLRKEGDEDWGSVIIAATDGKLLIKN